MFTLNFRRKIRSRVLWSFILGQNELPNNSWPISDFLIPRHYFWRTHLTQLDFGISPMIINILLNSVSQTTVFACDGYSQICANCSASVVPEWDPGVKSSPNVPTKSSITSICASFPQISRIGLSSFFRISIVLILITWSVLQPTRGHVQYHA